jgi:putative ABC transport system permease protein
MIGMWLAGLLKTRLGRLAGTAACLCIAVAVITDLGLFIDHSSRSMTERALATLTTDFQVQLVPGMDVGVATQTIRDAVPTLAVAEVGYGSVTAFELQTNGTTQTTGAGKAVGLPPDYFSSRTNDIRVLAGDMSGAVLLQQTAANLHAQPGDTVTLKFAGSDNTSVKVTGVVDLKTADAFFQAIGILPGAAPVAPPDNAVLMPIAAWKNLYAANSADARTQLHVVIDRSILGADPNDAYAKAAGIGRNLEARFAGNGIVGNNLAAQLDATRGDALYARVLFLFLGVPGAVLGVLLSLVIARSDAETRNRDQGLLRLRGAAPGRILSFLVAETLGVGAIAAVSGVLVALLAAQLLAGIDALPLNWPVLIAGIVIGLLLAVVAVFIPALAASQGKSVIGSRASNYRTGNPIWQRLYLDVALLLVSGLLFWKTAASGYQIVLATEGVTATAVDYTAFLAPLLFWIGGGLLVIRLVRFGLARGQGPLARMLEPIAGPAKHIVASALRWQRFRVSLSVALVALATAFLISTAIFNATYEAQARVDAELTNGADVTITGTAAGPADKFLNAVAKLDGVAAAEPMQHRYAYVGTDLQDLYGIDPARLDRATDLSNAYFRNGDAQATLRALARQADAVLVSEETVTDFQLAVGDKINLRLQGADHTYHAIPFTFVGVVREFPTAPHDSFLVANASYVAQMTGLAAAEDILVRSNGDIAALKNAITPLIAGSSLQVTSLLDAVHTIGTSLTAVDVRGLSRIELVFAVLLAIAATGLNLALGFEDRRRDWVILRALGARGRKLASFVWSEAGVVLLAGATAGAVIGTVVAQILIVVLQGVFDPPPETPSVPWLYIIGALFVLGLAAVLAAVHATYQAEHAAISRMREQR